MKALHFNSLLTEAGIPLKQANLLRHQKIVPGRPTPYSLWRDNREDFNRFQSYQNPKDRSYFSRPFWASFVVTPHQETLFVGLYNCKRIGSVSESALDPITGTHPGSDKKNAGANQPYDLYDCVAMEELDEYAGRLIVEWGLGHRSWGQVAVKKDKKIIALRKAVVDPPFPGFTDFISPLSDIGSLPPAWLTALSSVRGIYLLTCPRTKEQYVGMASSESGFVSRWQTYSATGHGGNVALKSRDPSDYQVSILEVLGSAATNEDLQRAETLWKKKLQSREMGLNRN